MVGAAVVARIACLSRSAVDPAYLKASCENRCADESVSVALTREAGQGHYRLGDPAA